MPFFSLHYWSSTFCSIYLIIQSSTILCLSFTCYVHYTYIRKHVCFLAPAKIVLLSRPFLSKSFLISDLGSVKKHHAACYYWQQEGRKVGKGCLLLVLLYLSASSSIFSQFHSFTLAYVRGTASGARPINKLFHIFFSQQKRTWKYGRENFLNIGEKYASSTDTNCLHFIGIILFDKRGINTL